MANNRSTRSVGAWRCHAPLLPLLLLLVISVSACDNETIPNNPTNNVTSADLVLETATETPTKIPTSTSVPTSTHVPTAISGWYPHPGLYKPNPTRTPIPPYSITLDQPLAFDFYDEQHGWVVVDNGTLNTSDGGLSWSPKIETYILKATSDGGQTWSSIYSSTINIQSISLGSPLDGWFVMSDTLGITHDAGATWQISDAFAYTSPVEIDFPDSKNGWVNWWVYDNSIGSIGTKAGLAHSTDGGETWTQATYPSLYRIHSISFTNDSLGWVLCSEMWGAGSAWKAVYKTDDAGATWSLINESSSDPNGIPRTEYPNDLSFADDKNGLLGFGRTPYWSIVRTTDGGLTWGVERTSYSDRSLMTQRGWTFQMLTPAITFGIYGVYSTIISDPNSQTGLVKSNRDTQTSMQVYPPNTNAITP